MLFFAPHQAGLAVAGAHLRRPFRQLDRALYRGGNFGGVVRIGNDLALALRPAGDPFSHFKSSHLIPLDKAVPIQLAASVCTRTPSSRGGAYACDWAFFAEVSERCKFSGIDPSSCFA